MTGHRIGRLALALGAAAALAGCQDTGPFAALQRAPADAAGTARLGTAPTMVETEVEAPEVFATTEPGLWDGRPSLGGVWIAHPDATGPERVLIRNTENGKSIVGALFRREREMPGPELQVSSDAAAALDLLAGKPTELDVVALRREEVPGEAPAPAEPPAAADAPSTEAAPMASAAAAIDVAETRAANATPPRARPAAAPVPVATQAQPRRPLMAPGDVVAPPPGAVDIPGDAAAATTAVPDATAPEAARPRASSLDKPFIQIGIFNVKDYAEDVAERLRGAGVVPTVLDQESDGKAFWRVVVGPATTRPERSALLEKVRGLGYTDAYHVTN